MRHQWVSSRRRTRSGTSIRLQSMFSRGEARLRVFPTRALTRRGMTWLLPRLVGNQVARKFFFNSEVWTAEQALDYGAVDELADPSVLLDRAIEVAGDWGKWSVSSRKGTKQL